MLGAGEIAAGMFAAIVLVDVTPRLNGPSTPDQLLSAAANINLPVLLIRGRSSDVVTEAEVEEFLRLIPHAEYVDVDKARHMVAGDRNDIFTEAVTGFLRKLQPDADAAGQPGAGQ